MLGAAAFQDHDARIEVAGGAVDVASLEGGLERIHHGDGRARAFGNCGISGTGGRARSRASAHEP